MASVMNAIHGLRCMKAPSSAAQNAPTNAPASTSRLIAMAGGTLAFPGTTSRMPHAFIASVWPPRNQHHMK